MDGDKLSEGVVVTNFCIGGLSVILEVLASRTDGRKGVEFVVLAYCNGALKDKVGVKAAPGPNPHPVPDDTVRSYFHIIPDVGLG